MDDEVDESRNRRTWPVSMESDIRTVHAMLDMIDIAKADTLRERFGFLLQLEAQSVKDDALLRADLVEVLKYIGDMDHELKKDIDRLYDKNFPWDYVNKAVWATADIRHKYFGHIPTWELTNDPKYRSDMLKALHRDENGNKLPEGDSEYTEWRHGKKVVTFTVNGKETIENPNYMASYSDILDWAGYNQTTTIPYTVTFRWSNGLGGTMTRNSTPIEVVNEMVFNVHYTGDA